MSRTWYFLRRHALATKTVQKGEYSKNAVRALSYHFFKSCLLYFASGKMPDWSQHVILIFCQAAVIMEQHKSVVTGV